MLRRMKGQPPLPPQRTVFPKRGNLILIIAVSLFEKINIDEKKDFRKLRGKGERKSLSPVLLTKM